MNEPDDDLDYDAAVEATLKPTPEAAAMLHFLNTTTHEDRLQIYEAIREHEASGQ